MKATCSCWSTSTLGWHLNGTLKHRSCSLGRLVRANVFVLRMHNTWHLSEFRGESGDCGTPAVVWRDRGQIFKRCTGLTYRERVNVLLIWGQICPFTVLYHYWQHQVIHWCYTAELPSLFRRKTSVNKQKTQSLFSGFPEWLKCLKW